MRIINARSVTSGFPPHFSGHYLSETGSSFALMGSREDDLLDIKIVRILIMTSSNYLLTARLFFWPDVFLHTVFATDCGNSVLMAICKEPITSMESEVLIIAEAKGHLHSRGLLNSLTDGTNPDRETIGEAVAICFTREVVRAFFELFLGYARLPRLLHFVYALKVLLSEGR